MKQVENCFCQVIDCFRIIEEHIAFLKVGISWFKIRLSSYETSLSKGCLTTFTCNAEAVHEKVDELQEDQNIPDDSTAESDPRPGVAKISMNDDDLKSPHSLDAPVSALLF